MRVEGFTLDLYCSNTDAEVPESRTALKCLDPRSAYLDGGRGQFFGHNKRAAYAEARKSRWKLGKDQDFCPFCVRGKNFPR